MSFPSRAAAAALLAILAVGLGAAEIVVERPDQAVSFPETWAYVSPGDEAKLTGKSRGAIKDICPSLEGGKSPASPAAFSPRTGLFYVPTLNLCMDWQSEEAAYIPGPAPTHESAGHRPR